MKIKKIFVTATLFLVTIVSIADASKLDKITIGGMLSIQHVDSKSAEFATQFFYLGSIPEDPSLDHSYITFSAEVTKDISMFYKRDLTGDYSTLADGETNIDNIEEAYIEIKNIRKVREEGDPTVNLKAGIFTVPFGLGVIKGVDDPTDKGVLIYGSYGEKGNIINYEVAIVDGDTSVGTDERDIYLKGSFLYRNIPSSLSIYRGKAGKEEKKRRAIALSANYIISEDSRIEGQYISTKYDDESPSEVRYLYLKGEKKFKEQNTTAYIKYIEENPKGNLTTTTMEYAVEYEYGENTIIKAAYVDNKERLQDNEKIPKEDLFKIELRIEF